MQTLWAVIRTEMRLTWRRPTFWLVQLLWLLPLALNLIANRGTAGALAGGPSVIGDQLTTSLMLWLVLLPLIIGPALIRDLGLAGEIVWTAPLDALLHMVGVVAGLLLALLPALFVQLAAQSVVLTGSPVSVVWRYGAPLLLASTMAGVGVAALLALLLRRTLLLLLAWLALWVAVMQVSMGFFGTIASVALLSRANVFFHNLELSSSVGLGPARALVQGLVLWFAGVGVLAALLAGGIALLADRRRTARLGPLLATWCVVAGLLAGGGWLLHARAVEAQSPVISPADIQADLWRVETHTLDVEVDPRRDFLSGSSTLRLHPTRSTEDNAVVLRLNPGLAVTGVRDEHGESLDWRREGDSIVVALLSPANEPITLQLQWQGTLSVPYSDYGARLGYRFPAFDSPQPVRALLYGGVGFLFRDGDWYPWPWGSRPDEQRAAESRVTLRVAGAEALASVPIRDGVALWEGELPSVLLALPPSLSRSLDGRMIHVGALGGAESVLVRRLELLAALAPRMAEALGAAEAPEHIVALPYLHDIVWSGDLLLVPEGTGFARDDLDRLLLAPSFEGEAEAGTMERALMTALTRVWLDEQMPLPSGWVRVARDEIVALAGVAGTEGIVRLPEAADDPRGRWLRAPGDIGAFAPSSEAPSSPSEVEQDLRTVGDTPLSSEVYRDLLALWIAIELAEPAVREVDLAVLLAPVPATRTSTTFEPFLLRVLPFDFPNSHAPKAALLAALHEWLEEVGRERGLRLVGEAVRESNEPFDLTVLLAQFEAASGVEIGPWEEESAE